ncbi:Cysteine-rich protein 2-binding protein [Termitomyces sp. J132]|nr:Cysteine-rich protein 2-binding protein [Termitomyces sp. J132]
MIELGQNGESLRPPTKAEVSRLIISLANSNDPMSVTQAIAERKLKLDRERRRAGVTSPEVRAADSVTPLPTPRRLIPPHPQVIEALDSIQTTPFALSFLSRLQGTRALIPSSAIAIDWETITPWMSLMADIREHYVLSHPEREQPVETLAPIIYTSLEESHLRDVHEMLERVFWNGINVTDSLDHFPDRCTVVASYKRLVVGVAILSSPRETYITYLAVRAGWDNAGIARSMLYHLIMLNPKKDITLHVSVNNSAMARPLNFCRNLLLYNRFGFKAEEFTAGFYEQYLAPNSRASKNAFRLRLRQQ